MSNRNTIITGLSLSVFYFLYLYWSQGSKWLGESFVIKLGSTDTNVVWAYPFILDMFSMILALIILILVIRKVTSVQKTEMIMSAFPYLDIYLIGMFAFTSIISGYGMVVLGFGLGATGLVAFGLSYLLIHIVMLLWIE